MVTTPAYSPNEGAARSNSVSLFIDTVRRAFSEFVKVPTAIIIAFLFLAVFSYLLDRSQLGWLQPARQLLKRHVFANPKATSDLLGAVAAGIITMTSVTISLLLIAVQQAASAMTSAVFDQFLRRRHNQIYFGFFIGIALYALITLATVNSPFNPVFGGTIAFIGTVIALYLLILLLYTTINQMRPVEVIEAIHDHVLNARTRQLRFLAETRRAPQSNATPQYLVAADKHGFVTHIDLKAIGATIESSARQAEVVLLVSVGSHVAFGQRIAAITGCDSEVAKKISKTVSRAIRLERQRDILIDPSYGIEQLQMIAWTSISTAKSNPTPGLLTIFSLRDVLARWSAAIKPEPAKKIWPVVCPDDAPRRLLDAFESLAVVSSESMQHQNYIAVLETFSGLFERLPNDQQNAAEDRILRILSALGDHVLTTQLAAALTALAGKLRESNRPASANAVQTAHDKLAQSVGQLNSRATRVK
jgi:uncharacterized membrane protein